MTLSLTLRPVLSSFHDPSWSYLASMSSCQSRPKNRLFLKERTRHYKDMEVLFLCNPGGWHTPTPSSGALQRSGSRRGNRGLRNSGALLCILCRIVQSQPDSSQRTACPLPRRKPLRFVFPYGSALSCFGQRASLAALSSGPFCSAHYLSP